MATNTTGRSTSSFQCLLATGERGGILLGARLTAGSTIIEGVTQLYEDVTKAHHACAAAMRDAAHQSHTTLKSIREQSGDKDGCATMYDLWAEANHYIMQFARLQDHLAKALRAKVVDPMHSLQVEYEKVSKRVLDIDVGEVDGAHQPTSKSISNETELNKKVKKANDKVKLASEELETATLNREALMNRFGNDLQPDLAHRINERVRLASLLKQQAEVERREITAALLSEKPAVGSMKTIEKLSGRKYKIDADRLHSAEHVEQERGYKMREVFKNCAQSAIEAYSPRFDWQSWLVKEANARCDLTDISDTIPPLTQAEIAWLQNRKPPALTDSIDQSTALESMKNVLKTKDNKIRDLHDEIELLKEENDLLRETQQKGFRPGGLEKELEYETNLPAVQSPGETSKLDKYEQDQSPIESVLILPQRRLTASEASMTKSSAHTTNKGPEKKSLFKHMATVLRGGIKHHHSEFGASETIGDETEPLPVNGGADYKPNSSFSSDQGDPATQDIIAKMDSGTYGSFRLSDYIPNLHQRLKISVPPGTKPSEKFLEIQRRFEEYLWALRNLHLNDLCRLNPWDSDEYFRGFDFEYAYQTYPCKMPCNNYWDAFVNKKMTRAPEWGCSNMTPYQWKLTCYEMLLLVYHTLSLPLIAREVARLPKHDINELSADDFNKAADSKPNAQFKGKTGDPPRTSATSAYPEDLLYSDKEGSQQAQAAVILESNTSQIRSLVRQWRISLGISAQDNSTITTLLLPAGLEYGEEGASLGFAPLDVRFRVSRLHTSWVLAAREAAQGVKRGIDQKITREWIFRQLHVIRISILQKIARMQKFLPQLDAVNQWLNQWPFKFNWSTFICTRIPDPDSVDDKFCRGNLHQLVNCVKLCLMVISDLFAAYQSNRWGHDVYLKEPKEVVIERYNEVYEDTNSSEMSGGYGQEGYEIDENNDETNHKSNGGGGGDFDNDKFDAGYGYRNAEGFLRLVALMTCLVGIDKSIRRIVADDEKEMTSGVNFNQSHSMSMIDETLSTDEGHQSDDNNIDDNPQDASELLCVGDDWMEERFDLFYVLNNNTVDTYWQYEQSFQHLVLSEMTKLVTDTRAPSKLSSDAESNIQTIIVAAHVMQHGLDPTLTDGGIRVPSVLITLETIALYVLKSVWEALMNNAGNNTFVQDEFSFSLDAEPSFQRIADETVNKEALSLPNNLLITKDVVVTMNQIAADFINWLLHHGQVARKKIGGIDSSGTLVSGTTSTMVAGPQPSETRYSTINDLRISDLRTSRLLSCTPHNLFDALGKTRGEYRFYKRAERERNPDVIRLGANNKLMDWNDPDFAVLDFDELDEIADMPNFFQQITSIRGEPEGISTILPSRIERMISEICLRRLVTDTFRRQLYQSLIDYRHHYEAESLTAAIDLWKRVEDMLVLTPTESAPRAPDLDEFTALGPLSSMLGGPIAKYDLYRFFIVKSIRNLFDRIFSDALRTLDTPTEEEESESEKLEIEVAWSKVIKKFSDAATSFLTELRAELIFYTASWTQVLPGNQHALIIIHAADDRLRVTLERLKASPFWSDEDFPPNGAQIVATLAQFDRLVREIRVCTRYDHLLNEHEPLAASLIAQVTLALTKKLRSVETMLDRCVNTDSWMPINPPECMYSVTAVDFFQFVHHILEAVWSFSADCTVVIDILVRFIWSISHQFADFVKGSVTNSKLIKLSRRCDEIFQHLCSPTARVDVSVLGQLIRGRKDKKKKGILGFVGIGGKKSKQKDLAHQLQAIQRQTQDSVSVTKDTLNVPELNYSTTPIDSGDSGSGESSDSMSGDDMAATLKPTRKKKEHKSKKSASKGTDEQGGNGEAEVTEEMKELAGRIGPMLAVYLINVSTSLPKSPLPTWLTRLHNLGYFLREIPVVAQNILKSAAEQITEVDPRHAAIQKALERAGGRKVAPERSPGDTSIDDSLKLKQKNWENQIQGAIDQCKQYIRSRLKEVCQLIALRVVYYDLYSDLFEEMYYPTFQTGQRIAGLVACMNQTVLKLVQAAPEECRQELLTAIIHQMAKAWAMLITELGYNGHTFTPEDLQIIEGDLQALKGFAATYRIDENASLGLSAEKSVGGLFSKFKRDDEKKEGNGGNDKQPIYLAQLGGNHSPEKKEKKPAASSGGPTPINLQEHQLEPTTTNVFADLTDATPAFDAKDILGAHHSKEKGVFGGVLKGLKLNKLKK